MATITSTIGTGGRNYSTVAAWIASLPANAVTAGNSYVGMCYNDSLLTDGGFALTGHTTDVLHTITLTAAAGQSFLDHASRLTNPLKWDQAVGAAIGSANDYRTMFEINDNNVILSRLQFKSTGATQFCVLHTGFNMTVDNCIFQSTARNGANVFTVQGVNSTARNVLVVAMSNWGRGMGMASGAAAINCTVVKPSDIVSSGTDPGLQASYSNNIFRNCASFGFDFNSTTGVTQSFNNLTDKTDAPGTNNLVSKTYAAQFVGTTSGAMDFRLKTGADAIGASLSDDAWFPASIDIVGTARPQGTGWDIGAWELASAAAPAYRPRIVRWG